MHSFFELRITPHVLLSAQTPPRTFTALSPHARAAEGLPLLAPRTRTNLNLSSLILLESNFRRILSLCDSLYTSTCNRALCAAETILGRPEIADTAR